MKEHLSAALAAFLFALIGVVAEQDYADAVAEESAYCARVADGTHTDYLRLREVCSDRH